MILPKERDPRFITIRRGGTLTDANHRLLALWAADCAEHVLHLFERVAPHDDRPRRSIELCRAWARGELRTREALAKGASLAAAREVTGPAKLVARAAAQALAVSHVAAHELGAAAYAIRAVREAAPEEERDEAGRAERRWQRQKRPPEIRELVLDDQRLRNHACWHVFTD